VESEWAFHTGEGTLGEHVGNPLELRPIDVINDLFTRESERGGKSNVVDVCARGAFSAEGCGG
jgi:hypothetical protein